MTEAVALDPMALTDLPSARDYLKLETNVQDDRVRMFINAATTAIEMHCRRRLKARDYNTASAVAGHEPTLKLNGNGCNELLLPEWPANSVTSVTHRYEDGVTTRALTLTGMVFATGHLLYLPYDSFPRGKKNIEVVCNLGYTAAANARELRALEMACLRLVQVMWQDRDMSVGRGTAVSSGGESVNLLPGPMPPDVAAALAPFVRLV